MRQLMETIIAENADKSGKIVNPGSEAGVIFLFTHKQKGPA